MSFREEIVKLGKQAGSEVTEVCRRFQISRKTFYKWLKRYQQQGVAGLSNQSRRPKKSPKRIEPRVEEKILHVRGAYPSWGARKIRHILVKQAEVKVPASSTIHRVLQRNGRIDPEETEKHQAWQRFEHKNANDLWQMDFKGWFKTQNQRQCHPLTVLDDHSRYVVCLKACANQQTETVQTELSETFRRYGLPLRMTMDNGAPWGDDLEHRYTRLTVWLIRLGIRVSHSRPHHPQTQGKDERFHRTLDVDLLRWRHFEDLQDVQQQFDQYRGIYNQQRPHQALGMQVPSERYSLSPRVFPETLAPIEYDSGDEVRRVQQKGRISYGGYTLVVAKAFAGYPVAVRPTMEDGIVEVYFCHDRIGQFDLRETHS